MSAPTERRKDYMISRRVHFLYMLTWIASLLLVAAFGLLAWKLLALRTQVQGSEAAGGLVLVGALAFVIVAAALVLGVTTIVHTHRMIGSAFHVSVYLEKLTAGQTQDPLVLREGDFFTDIAEGINRLREARGNAPAATSGTPPKS